MATVAEQSTSTSTDPPPAKKKKEPFIQPIGKAFGGSRKANPVSAGDALGNDAAILLGEKEEDDGSFVDVESQQTPVPKIRVKENLDKFRNAGRAAAVVVALKEARGTIPDVEMEENAGAEAMLAQDDEETGHRDEYELEDGEKGKNDGGPIKRGLLGFLRFRCRQRARNNKIIVEVIKPKLPEIKIFFMTSIFFIILPMLLVASILFYVVGNPIAGCIDAKDKSNCASFSWWVIFLGIRQVITFGLAKGIEILFVEIIALRTKLFVRILGPYVTLVTVQARGWPFIIFFWAVLDLSMLYGGTEFSDHWMFYQNKIDMMNGKNPAGNITYTDIYVRILAAVMFFGGVVGLKRGWLALYLGKNSVRHYGKQVEKLIKKMLLVADVAHLAEEISDEYFLGYYGAGYASHATPPSFHLSAIRGISDDEDDEGSASERNPKSMTPSSTDNTAAAWQRLRTKTEEKTAESTSGAGNSGKTFGTTMRTQGDAVPRPGLQKQPRALINLSKTTKIQLSELVGEWDEPQIVAESGAGQEVTIQEVLQFRRAVATLDNRYPFSVPYGSFQTRETCIECAQSVYEDLLLRIPETGIALPFETIALAALKPNGELDEDKAKKLLRMFRCDRDGYLTALDFVKSVDNIYKNLRTLRASIANSSQIDRAFEQIFNVAFYFLAGLCAVLMILGVDAMGFFLSFSTVFISFSFLFGSAASKYFEGVLLILVRRPYDIGDRVAISNPQNDTSSNGSAAWFVEGTTLYTTTVRFGTTNEVATYSNGSLASMRIINANRSPKATVYIYLKFASDIAYERVLVLKSVVEKFVKDRPRQWLSMNAFRATRIEVDMGFIEYVLVLVHTEKWQNIGAILTSKAEASSYCLEVQKKLDMRYTAPPLPVNLEMSQRGASVFEAHEIGENRANTTSAGTTASAPPDLGALTSLFVPPEPKKTK
uniref:Mechanosensitive ion channel MscS domain-containing protein n=1 Tax=Odontella aurita TaxID=265563 RepID=A0A7S4I0R0_9STRA